MCCKGQPALQRIELRLTERALSQLHTDKVYAYCMRTPMRGTAVHKLLTKQDSVWSRHSS